MAGSFCILQAPEQQTPGFTIVSRTPVCTTVQRWLTITQPSWWRLQCSEKPPGSATGSTGRCDRCEGARPSLHSVQLGTAVLQRVPCVADSQNCPWALGKGSDCPGQEPAGNVLASSPPRPSCNPFPSAVTLWMWNIPTWVGSAGESAWSFRTLYSSNPAGSLRCFSPVMYYVLPATEETCFSCLLLGFNAYALAWCTSAIVSS